MRNKFAHLLKLSLENQPAISEKEQEITIYARIGNPDGLTQAYDSESQVQAEIKIDQHRRIRVRKTIRTSQEPIYELTTKILINNQEGVRSFIEQTQSIDADVFEMFKDICTSYQNKTRYFFKIENITVTQADSENSLNINDFVYEVDVFRNKEGKLSEYCKIDLEIQGLEEKFKQAGMDVGQFNITAKISNLPFAPTDFILMSADTSEEDKQKVSQLYDAEFLVHNELPQSTQADEGTPEDTDVAESQTNQSEEDQNADEQTDQEQTDKEEQA